MRSVKIHFWDDTDRIYVESDFSADVLDCYCGSPAVVIGGRKGGGFTIKCSSDFSILKCCDDSYRVEPGTCMSTTADNIASASQSWSDIIASIAQFSNKEYK